MPAVEGTAQLRAVARDLRRAASSRGMRGKLRRNLAVAVQPMKHQVEYNALAIPARDIGRQTGLRIALADATRTVVRGGGHNVLVRLQVDGKRMPAGQQALPPMVEGESHWRHPVFGKRDVWVTQPPHPFFRPAIPPHLSGVQKSVLVVIDETATELARGV